MASTKINTIQVIDSRIDPQPDPTYAATIGPDQNQWYKLESSGKTPNSVSFNNLTTLGKDRAYLDSFELGITTTIKFHYNGRTHGQGKAPFRGMFMPQSFPFNSICDQVQVNINGGAFFSNPSQTIRAKERYWDESKMAEAYANVCPIRKPIIQNELGFNSLTNTQIATGDTPWSRSRILGLKHGLVNCGYGPLGCTNYDILPDYDAERLSNSDHSADPSTGDKEIQITWREPIMCSPFSSRYDATYGRPLYNITSIDIQFKILSSLKNMFLCIAPDNIDSWDVSLDKVDLYYQVMTVSAPIPHDITVIPYRRYVPFITNAVGDTAKTNAHGYRTGVEITSSVYTLNEVPTAIWIFAAPQLSFMQNHVQETAIEGWTSSQTSTSNKLFGFLKNISISCGNTTQILNTAEIHDLYRIAKANGCQDNFADWSRTDPFENWVEPHVVPATTDPAYPAYNSWNHRDFATSTKDVCSGVGSVLRLIPGVDIVLPEQKLIPGANANNLVFQAKATFDFNFGGTVEVPVALWILFEYVGVATFTPGNCMVSMNPLGNGGIMENAPVVSAAQVQDVSKIEGFGWLDTLKSVFSTINNIAKKTGILHKVLPYVPVVGPALSSAAEKLGYGETGLKRPRVSPSSTMTTATSHTSGGAVMGLGDFC